MFNANLSNDKSLHLHERALSANQLLASLPSADLQRIGRNFKSRTFRAREVVQKQEEPIRDIYFFTHGACSLVKVMRDGQTAEIASIGREGAIGAWSFFGEDRTLGDTVVAGRDAQTETLSVDLFREEMDRHGVFHNLLIRYSQALTAQLMQTTVCNSLHSAEERCCRWLLATQERLGGSELPVTHEFVASMLGVRRPTVTLIFSELSRLGTIEYRRGSVMIKDRKMLEDTSCECHQQIMGIYRRLLPDVQ